MSVGDGGDADRAVGVVVVTWNSAEVLPGLIESLADGMEGLDWHLVVADNASTDRTLDVVRGIHPEPRIAAGDRNLGFAAGVNRGIALTDPTSDVLVLNPDVRLHPGAGRQLQRALRAPATGIAAPRIEDGSGKPVAVLRHEPSASRALAETVLGVRLAGRIGWGEAILDRRSYSRSTVADWASAAALMISRECLAECGPWDESFFLYSEDTDYALRARERGFATRLAPDARATHLGGDSRRDPELWTLLTLNKVTLHRRRHGAWRGRSFRAASVVREFRFAITGNRASWRAMRSLLTDSQTGQAA